jgi:uncharacterized alkaline shock family protein YloU
MRLITKIALLFYSVVILFLVAFAIGLAVHVIPVRDVTLIAQVIYEDQQLRVIAGLIAVLIFFMNILFNRAIAGKEFREKNIAFDNPAGRVTVSLTAMEDLIRQVICRMKEVKDVRGVRIKASKRGLEARVNLALYSEVSIPEITAQLQEITKRKILDTIGLEETVVVRVDITKIALEEKKNSRNGDKKIKSVVDDFPATVPFQGYRA